jgi:hypothetical protein
VALAVTDTGVGIPAVVLARVFEPFFTTNEPGKGSGLGLSQVFGFAKQSGGGVAIETRVGEGTSVKVYLPRAAAAGDDPKQESVDAQQGVRTTSTVLVVDDDKAVLRSIVRVLEFLRYAAIPAENGGEALRLIASRPETDLVLADLAMVTGHGDLENLEEFEGPGSYRSPIPKTTWRP